MKDKKLYIVFSATPLKMGTLIRKVTRESYNHISVSLCPKLSKMYSFARHYKKAPLYGGFVCETPSRYRHNNKVAGIFVCALPINNQQYMKIKNQLDYMSKNKEKYSYNLISAAFAPLNKRFYIKNSFTCAEFAAYILSMVSLKFHHDRFYSIEDIRKELIPYAVYFGPFYSAKLKESGEYEKRISFYDICKYTIKSVTKNVADSKSHKNKPTL